MDEPWKTLREVEVTVGTGGVVVWLVRASESRTDKLNKVQELKTFEGLPAFLRQQIALLDVAHPPGEATCIIKEIGGSFRGGDWRQYYILIPREHKEKVWCTLQLLGEEHVDIKKQFNSETKD